MADAVTVTAPVAGYEGTVAGARFVDGKAEVERSALGYFRQAGYRIAGEDTTTSEEDRLDARDATSTSVGTSLRDAAVDPQPEDFLPPVNAGRADPHGPDVAAPGLHAVEPPSLVPGSVGTPEEQQDVEAAKAASILVGDQVVESAVDAPTGETPDRPSRSDPVAEWRSYAIGAGMDPEEAKMTSKADLVDRYAT